MLRSASSRLAARESAGNPPLCVRMNPEFSIGSPFGVSSDGGRLPAFVPGVLTTTSEHAGSGWAAGVDAWNCQLWAAAANVRAASIDDALRTCAFVT